MTMRLDNGYAVSAVPPSMLNDAWPAVGEMVAEALQYSWGWTPSDCYRKIEREQATLWVVEKDMEIKAAIVTEILEYPACKTLNIWILAGKEFAAWADLVVAAEAYGRAQGCEWIEATGRPGLQRLLKEMGFNVPRVVCGKKIETTVH